MSVRWGECAGGVGPGVPGVGGNELLANEALDPTGLRCTTGERLRGLALGLYVGIGGNELCMEGGRPEGRCWRLCDAPVLWE